MATLRTLLNNVLRGLRQFSLIDTSETTTTDEYKLFIIQLINEAKEEIEECGWPWYPLRSTVTITLSSGTAEYDISTGGAADTDTNDRSYLLYENLRTHQEGANNSDYSAPQMFNVTNSDEYRLTEHTQERMERIHLTDSDETGKPTEFAIWNDGDTLRMKVWPTPDATYTLKARIYIPQAELSGTALTTTLSIPARPVWMRALFKANEERGSELGRPGSSLYMAAQDALGSATGIEMRRADETVHFED